MTTQDLTDLKQLFEFAILTGDKPELTKSDCEMVVAAVDRVLKSEWRPIESAPKGGGAELVTDPNFVKPPLILLHFPWRGDHCVARWDWYYAEGGAGYEARFGPHGAWIEPVSGERVVLHYDPPSHWCPLDPPKVSV